MLYPFHSTGYYRSLQQDGPASRTAVSTQHLFLYITSWDCCAYSLPVFSMCWVATRPSPKAPGLQGAVQGPSCNITQLAQKAAATCCVYCVAQVAWQKCNVTSVSSVNFIVFANGACQLCCRCIGSSTYLHYITVPVCLQTLHYMQR